MAKIADMAQTTEMIVIAKNLHIWHYRPSCTYSDLSGDYPDYPFDYSNNPTSYDDYAATCSDHDGDCPDHPEDYLEHLGNYLVVYGISWEAIVYLNSTWCF